MAILCVIFMQTFNTAFSPFSYMVVKGPFMMEEASKIFSFLFYMGFLSLLTIKLKVKNTQIIKNGKHRYEGGRDRRITPGPVGQ